MIGLTLAGAGIRLPFAEPLLFVADSVHVAEIGTLAPATVVAAQFVYAVGDAGPGVVADARRWVTLSVACVRARTSTAIRATGFVVTLGRARSILPAQSGEWVTDALTGLRTLASAAVGSALLAFAIGCAAQPGLFVALALRAPLFLRRTLPTLAPATVGPALFFSAIGYALGFAFPALFVTPKRAFGGTGAAALGSTGQQHHGCTQQDQPRGHMDDGIDGGLSLLHR